jgi:hypothetical protein
MAAARPFGHDIGEAVAVVTDGLHIYGMRLLSVVVIRLNLQRRCLKLFILRIILFLFHC